jgi:hypothetical protein
MEVMDVDGSGASPSPMGRFTPSQPLLTQSAPSLIGSQPPLHPYVQLDSLQSPLPPSPNTKKSPKDDLSNSGALRLPSITPQGFLVEGTSYPESAGPHLGSVLDALRGSEPRDGMAASMSRANPNRCYLTNTYNSSDTHKKIVTRLRIY